MVCLLHIKGLIVKRQNWVLLLPLCLTIIITPNSSLVKYSKYGPNTMEVHWRTQQKMIRFCKKHKHIELPACFFSLFSFWAILHGWSPSPSDVGVFKVFGLWGRSSLGVLCSLVFRIIVGGFSFSFSLPCSFDVSRSDFKITGRRGVVDSCKTVPFTVNTAKNLFYESCNFIVVPKADLGWKHFFLFIWHLICYT